MIRRVVGASVLTTLFLLAGSTTTLQACSSKMTSSRAEEETGDRPLITAAKGVQITTCLIGGKIESCLGGSSGVQHEWLVAVRRRFSMARSARDISIDPTQI